MTRAVVVGTGIAGLSCALHAAHRGVEVTLVAKGAADQGATRRAQGGIAGVVMPEDRIEDHVADTLSAGAGLCDESAVRVLATEGPGRIRELAAWGVEFDRDPSGRLQHSLEAAHSFPRILHAGGDATGLAIETALLRTVRRTGIRIVEHAFLLGLVTGARGEIRGARVRMDGRDAVLPADAVVLATGGAGMLYARTTNPAGATGDGIAVALRAGAEVADLEFVQFHPTVLAAGDPFLVSEAVRGEGAVLIDDAGRRFAFDAHPDGELAPRDVVARAIASRMAEQGGRPVRLDATALGPDRLRTRFPSIDAATRCRGLDWAAEPIPVTPAAHYLMGGVRTDRDGRTTLPGLYAVGETARTGVHGANRLASNSLLEGAVFGARAAIAIAATGRRLAWAGPEPAPASGAPAPEAPAAAAHAPALSRHALRALMWEHVGLVRDRAGLAHAQAVIAAWRDRPVTSRGPGTVAQHEDDNLLLLAEATIAAAVARPASVGAHFLSDEPRREPRPSRDRARPEASRTTADDRAGTLTAEAAAC